MKKYNYEKIDKMIQPIMDMMNEEFPNDCKLIIDRDFAKIVFEHDYLIFESDRIKEFTEKNTEAIEASVIWDDIWKRMYEGMKSAFQEYRRR